MKKSLIEKAIEDAMNQTVRHIAQEIEVRVPRDTGGLAATLEVNLANFEGSTLTTSCSIGDSVHPAGPPEFGTVHQAPQPFYRPAVVDAPADFLRHLRSSMN